MICTVVLGHVIMALGGGKAEMAMFNFIYSFHMPLFVFLSGYFTRPGEMTEKSVRGAFHFLSLFILFDLLMWLVVPRDVNYRTILTPQYAMWYLLSMFYWRFLSMFVKKKWLTWRNLAMVTVFSALVGFVPFIGEIGSFNRTACFLCFFMAGMMCRGTDFFSKIKKIPVWVAIIPAIVIFVFMLNFHVYNDGLRYVYSNSYGTSLVRFVDRCGQMGAAVLLGIGFIRLSQLKMPKLFARLGQKTLFFYLYHTFFIAALPHVANTLELPRGLGWSAGYSLSIIVACAWLSRIKWLNGLLKTNMFGRCASGFYKRNLTTK